VLLLIDNYDSFTWNLRQYFEQLGEQVVVRRNDEVSITDIETIAPDFLVISPGPGKPIDAGVSLQIIETFAGKIPILGVCLGHQCIANVFGADIVKAYQPMHGKVSSIMHRQQGLFSTLDSPMCVTRYHSLVVDPETLSDEFVVDAWAVDKGTDMEIMAIRHKSMPIWGVQFHPESIMTENGHKLLANFLLKAIG
jgi:para-aminobenzoate synthetase component 2